MSDVFISYARPTANQAQAVAEALRSLGYSVWLDDELPAHRAYAHVIEEQMTAAKAALVIWSADAVKSEWVLSEANRAREDRKLIQMSIDSARLPMPFDQIQCADLAGWSGDVRAPGWGKVVASVAALMGDSATATAPVAEAPAPVLPNKPSIAVLPFANITGGKEEDYFSDGMVEEIVTALSRFPTLFVIASSSSLTFRDTARNLKQIAQELGVHYLLEGSVRKAGDRVRIAVKLADALVGEQIWAERFDGNFKDVFALQDSVAGAVAGQIAPSIEAADMRRAKARPTRDLDAYELYLRALHRERDYNKQALLETISLVDQAISRDPDYAHALAIASLMHSALPLAGWSDDPQASREMALGLGRRALRAGGDDPEVLAIVSNVLLWTGEDVGAADALAERALARNPGASFPWFASAYVKVFDGCPALAIEQWDTHLRLDPRSPYRPFIQGGMGLALVLLRRCEAAIPPLRDAVQLVPEHPLAPTSLPVAYAHLGRLAEAAEALKKLNPAVMHSVLDLFNDPAHHEFFRSGLALAGADV